jgi:hypothetical protein
MPSCHHAGSAGMPGSFTGPKPLRLGLLGLDGRDPLAVLHGDGQIDRAGSTRPAPGRPQQQAKAGLLCARQLQARPCPARVARSPFSPAHADRSSPLGSPLRLETATYPAARGQLGKATRGTGGLSDDQCGRHSLAVILPPYNTRNRFQHMPDVVLWLEKHLVATSQPRSGRRRRRFKSGPPNVCPAQRPCDCAYPSGVHRDFRRTARLMGACRRIDYRDAAMGAGSDAVHSMDQMSRRVVGAERRRRGRGSVAAGMTLIS